MHTAAYSCTARSRKKVSERRALKRLVSGDQNIVACDFATSEKEKYPGKMQFLDILGECEVETDTLLCENDTISAAFFE